MIYDKIMEKEERAYGFWRRVDELRGKTTLAELAKVIDVKEQSIRLMRSECRIPKTLAVNALADYLGTTAGYLIDGVESKTRDIPEVEFVRSSPEAQALVRAVMRDPALLAALSAAITSTEEHLRAQ